MRSYPRNSPEAAGRIVALVLLSDGHVCRSEFDALETLGASQSLGLAPDAMPRLVQTLCEDLLTGMCATGSMLANVDDATLASLMAEVDDRELQHKVLRLAFAAAAADHHLSEGEDFVLNAAQRHWQIELPPRSAAAAAAACMT